MLFGPSEVPDLVAQLADDFRRDIKGLGEIHGFERSHLKNLPEGTLLVLQLGLSPPAYALCEGLVCLSPCFGPELCHGHLNSCLGVGVQLTE